MRHSDAWMDAVKYVMPGSDNRPIRDMLERRYSFLLDIIRSGGRDRWSHLKTHGHHHATRDACLRLGLIEGDKRVFEITDAGRFEVMAA